MTGMPDPLTDVPPPSRFDPDDLNNFAANSPELSPPLIVGWKSFEFFYHGLVIESDLSWAPWARSLLQSGVLQPKLALFSVSDVGNHLLHQIPNKRILGSIVLDEISMVKIG